MDINPPPQFCNIDDSKEFLSKIVSRCHKLIDTGIWQGLEKDRLVSWVENVTHHDPSGLLAGCLLDNLIYRPRTQIEAILKELVTTNKTALIDNNVVDLLSGLKNDSDDVVWATPVLGLHQPPTKSGPYTLRIAQRLLSFKDSKLTWPFLLDGLPKNARVVIMFDDFCGSGDQFCDFISKNEIDVLRKKRPEIKFFYFVVSAHQQGINNIQDKYSFIDIRCAEVLNNKHNFFEEAYYKRYGEPELQNFVMSAYQSLTEHYGISSITRVSAEGYGNLGLSYAFEHATPNNTLPIFWYKSNDWIPLLDR